MEPLVLAAVLGASAGHATWNALVKAGGDPLALPWLRRGRLAASVRPALRNGAIGGVLAALAYGLVIRAMSRTNMTLVSALRETSVILAAVIGRVALRERFGARRIVAASLVALGVVALQLARGS